VRPRPGAIRPAGARALGPVGDTDATGTPAKPKSLALWFAVAGCATLSFTLFRLGPILVSDILFLCAALVIAVQLLVGDDHNLMPATGRRSASLTLVGSLLLLIFGTLSSLRSWAPADSMQVVLRFGWVTLAWFWIMRTVCRDRDDLYRLLGGWRIAALVTAGAAIAGQMGIAFVSTHAGERQVGLSAHPNHLAGQLVAVFPLFLLAVPPDRLGRTRTRLRWLVPLGVCATAIFASGSLTGLASAVASVAVVGLAYATTRTPHDHRRRRRSALTPVAVIAVLAAGVFALATSDLAVVDRIVRYQQGDTYVEESVASRGDRNSIVINQFDEYLVVGIGFNFEAASVDNTVLDTEDARIRDYGVHNMHLALLYQAGLGALAGVFLILMTAVRQLAALLRRADAELYRVTLALVGSFAAVNVNALFQPTTFDRFYWMPVALTGCLWAIRRQELRGESPVAAGTGTAASTSDGLQRRR
jgi:hypothetical protein